MQVNAREGKPFPGTEMGSPPSLGAMWRGSAPIAAAALGADEPRHSAPKIKYSCTQLCDLLAVRSSINTAVRARTGTMLCLLKY